MTARLTDYLTVPEAYLTVPEAYLTVPEAIGADVAGWW